MWADNETSLDLLGFRVHADLVKSVILNKDLLPITLGLFGDWGSGKTSIMEMLRSDFATEDGNSGDGVACLYFNGWLFEGYDDAKSAIISSILLQLGEHKRFGPKMRDGLVSLLKSVNWMRVASMGVKQVALPALSAYLTGGASLVPTLAAGAKDIPSSTVKGIADGEEADSEGETGELDWEQLIRKDKTQAEPLDVRSFRDRFAELINDSDIETLVILVDDLDRCSPERVIENLEAIKLFLSVRKTAFVIGADPRIVRHAIAHRYRSQIVDEDERPDRQSDLVTDYLEKLIQVPYYLPRLSPSETQTYMALLFCQRHLSDELFAKVVGACDKQREDDRYSVFAYPDIRNTVGDANVPQELANNLVMCAAIAPLVTEGLKGNPRQVKRFLNGIVLRKQLAVAASLEMLSDDVLAKLMVLEYGEHQGEFRQLYGWQAAQKGFPKQIADLEAALCPPDGKIDNEEAAKNVDAKWATSFMRRWIVMEPHLSDVDLRDYFWVARDRLDSTLSGVSLVPPVVRRCLGDLVSGTRGKVIATAKEAVNLSEDHQVVLLDQLASHVRRHPDQKKGYDALSELHAAGIAQAHETLGDVLDSVPPKTVPAALGVELAALLKSGGGIPAGLRETISKLAESKSRVGAAIKKQTEGRKR